VAYSIENFEKICYNYYINRNKINKNKEKRRKYGR
jgi:hypothetical protein